MSTRLVNVAILLLLVLELASGPDSFLVGEPDGRGSSGCIAPAISPWSCS